MSLAQIIRDLKSGQQRTIRHVWSEPQFPGASNMLAVYCLSLPYPVAEVWYQFDVNLDLVIADSYVRPLYRRLGLRARLNTLLFQSYPTAQKITTQMGSMLGKKFMRATGYRQVDRHWEVTRAVWEKRHG